MIELTENKFQKCVYKFVNYDIIINVRKIDKQLTNT